MQPLILGIHHITAISGDPQQNINFYAGILGLRLVKKTINFDAPDVYHFYFGDALVLYLLHENGFAEKVVMGQDFEKGQVVQFTVPAGVWQAGCTIEDGEFSVFGCTLSPGFTSSCFEAGLYDNLINKFPTQKQLLEKFCVKGEENKMPEGY